MAHRRQITDLLKKYENKKIGRIIVLTGARQVGKTTLAKDVYGDYHYLSIEDPTLRISLSTLTAKQWEKIYPQAILDEVQKEPKFIESIKSAYDQFDHVKYVLTGSSQILLLKNVRESLAGRCLIFTMQPLTIPELLTKSIDDDIIPSIWQQTLQDGFDPQSILPNFRLDENWVEKQKAWDFYTTFGAYPALTDKTMDDKDRFAWLETYVKTYLERDVKDLVELRDLEPYQKLQRALALQTGGLLNASSLATEIGVSSKTVKNYLQYLHVSFQTITLQSWERNKQKRLVKTPKIHCLDHGVLQAILNKRGLTGNEFESLVVSEIYKQVHNLGINASFYHLRTHDGLEVDMLIELPEGYYAFEIKMSEHIKLTDARHLRKLEEILDKPILHSFILSNDDTVHYFSEKITAMSAAMFLS